MIMGENKVTYLNHVFYPYGNIVGKDSETRFHRLMYRTDTLHPLMSKEDGYDYEEFNRVAKKAADIYYHPVNDLYYVPTGGGMCRIDVKAQRQYIRKLSGGKGYAND
jgi:hypothetical protein